MIAASSFAQLTKDEIRSILNIAMDDDEWHTPSASDISIHTQNESVVYGFFNCSKHNTFHDIELWFNINKNTVHIWKEEYVRDKINKNKFRPIYNLMQLANIISKLSSTSQK